MKIKNFISILTAGTIVFSAINFNANDYTKAIDTDVTDQVIEFYEQWKDSYIERSPYTTTATPDEYYVLYNGDEGGTKKTVSEAHGYGMLITASMAEYDFEAKYIFDGMYYFYKSHTSPIGKNLMAWQQTDNGSEFINSSGADSAADGDIDIAYALLIADSVWGSDGEINYKQEAINVINDIMKYEINKVDWLVQLGDWVSYSKPGDKYYDSTRSSDFIVQYFPIFAEVTGDENWNLVYENTLKVIDEVSAEYDTGLLPDFITKTSEGKFIPCEPNFLESDADGMYYYNSCRTPWRIGSDYLLNSNTATKEYILKLNNWIIDATNGNPNNILAGYEIDGTPYATWSDLCFTAPFLIAAKCDDSNPEWEEALYNYIINYGKDVYYGDTIKMLCLITYADLFPSLDNNKEEPTNFDINNDGVVDIEDLKLLQGYILNNATISTEYGKRADINLDGVVNAFDLILFKDIV